VVSAPEPQYGVQGIQELVTDVIPKLGFDSAKDVQVLCPMTRGSKKRNSTVFCKRIISARRSSLAVVLRVGDRADSTGERLRPRSFNGDLGTIAAIDLEEQEVTVQYQERRVTYDYADLNEIDWLSLQPFTNSKAGVSSGDSTFIYAVLHDATRNLLYTGLTCAKQLAIPGAC